MMLGIAIERKREIVNLFPRTVALVLFYIKLFQLLKGNNGSFRRVKNKHVDHQEIDMTYL